MNENDWDLERNSFYPKTKCLSEMYVKYMDL